ncbi:hypothetical protein [Shewanella gaetbuli]|uniref:Uncharacterized protein n=1 Tax=Shewanella gaetbuli TaxID=220752 RepID=A0A9X1ZJS2_9GAMM|nr:hypothetical protein [Shewanella gaetbuli]MCL1142811.1 hypothetical protein [Shewanella gaetbuli]
MNLKIFFGATALCLVSAPLLAEPVPLVINDNIKPKSYDRYIKAVHRELDTNGIGLAKTRYAIVQGMLNTKGFAWVFDGEGEGYILARFDYRGDTNVMRIEYNDKYVQLKYHEALGDYQCENIIEDICYKNGRGYYNYVKNLTASIDKQLRQR